MITVHVAYTYRGTRRSTSITAADRSQVSAELDNLERCGYDHIDILEVEHDDPASADSEDIPF